MRFCVKVDGIVNDYRNNELYRMKKIQVNYTSDGIGKTLSLGIAHDIQISIPFDAIIKMINDERGHK